MHPHRQSGVRAALVLFAASAVASARPIVALGPSDGLALDQPRVTVAFYKASTGAPLGPDLEIYPYTEFLLDTGANGILIGPITADNLASHGYETVATYWEQGVAGFFELEVSEPLLLQYAGSNGQPYLLEGVHALSNAPDPYTDPYGGWGGLIGMPGMVGHVVSWDNVAMVSEWLIGIDFGDTVPADPGHRYDIALTMVEFEQSGKEEPDDPNLTWSPLPFVEVRLANGPYFTGGEFLLDSGASMTIISTEAAIALGLDINGNGVIDLDTEAIRTEEVGGVGGSVLAPVVYIEEIALPSVNGPALTWTGAEVLVIDVATIPGILGADIFTSGWLGALFGGPPGYIDRIHFDFREPETLRATMHVDVNAEHDNVRLADPVHASYDLYDLALFTTQWLAPCPGDVCHNADLDGDGVVDNADLAILTSRWLAPSAQLPQP